jgi:hypothetical protein
MNEETNSGNAPLTQTNVFTLTSNYVDGSRVLVFDLVVIITFYRTIL